MHKADWKAADAFQNKFPHTYTAMEHLIMAMADAYNNRGKTSFFGYDKGLKSHKKYEDKLKDVLLSMSMDGLVARSASASEYRQEFLRILMAWFEIFPNWPDAAAFSVEQMKNENEAKQLINILIGVKV
jgi:hypothetical protein